MKWNEILAVFEELSYSQGFYGRLLRNLKEIEINNPEQYEDIKAEFEAQNFESPVDLILYIEQ